mmetsp:Transcript_47208/g.78254  ORF Transcript_47208/g.78254 Transcript_47208/m.78254 type:complete len:92 (+) Transcript_47208:77-352(+)
MLRFAWQARGLVPVKGQACPVRGFAKFKQKSHSGYKKRIKISKYGNFKHKKCFAHHNAEHLSGAKTLSLGKCKMIHKSARVLIKKGLPHGC